MEGENLANSVGAIEIIDNEVEKDDQESVQREEEI